MPISIIQRERFQRFSTFLNNLNNRKIFSFNRKCFRKTSDNHSLIFIRIITTSLYDRQNTLEYDGNSFNLIFQEIAWRNCSRNFGERIKSRANKQRTCVTCVEIIRRCSKAATRRSQQMGCFSNSFVTPALRIAASFYDAALLFLLEDRVAASL